MVTRSCEVCRNRPARYVCQECGRSVCERCFEPHAWLCADCMKQLEMQSQTLAPKGGFGSPPSLMKVFLLGFILILIGVVTVMIATLLYGSPDSVGLIVFIGPIPIILGAGEYSFLTIVLALILTVMSIVFFIVLRKQKFNGPRLGTRSAQERTESQWKLIFGQSQKNRGEK